LAFILALESLSGLVRRGRGASPDIRVPATSGQEEPGDPPTTDDALRFLLATGSRRGLADALGVPKSRVDTWAARVAPAPVRGRGVSPDLDVPVTSERGRDVAPPLVPAAQGQNGNGPDAA
jgi:hypothetical protein